METSLNLIWLAITLATIGLWRFRWVSSKRDSGIRLGLESAALVCALALLFPVISLTDDLHPETAIVDSASGKRSQCLIAVSGTRVDSGHSTLHIHSMAAVLPQLLSRTAFTATTLLNPSRIVRPIALAGSYSGLSPPSFR